MANIGTIVGELTLRDNFTGVLAKASTQLGKTSAKMVAAGASISQTGTILTQAITIPLGILSALTIKAATDFESSFAGIRKTVEATESQFADLSDGMRELAKTIPASVVEINNIGEAAGQLGIKVENIESFTRVMADLGVTTNLASNEAAISLARFANIIGLSQTRFNELGSAIVELGNNFETTEAEIIDAGLRIAAAGRIAGFTAGDILGLSAALRSVGVQAELGGTAIQKVLIRMTRAVAQGNSELRIFANVVGTTGREFAELFKRDPAEAFVQFVEGLKAAGNDAFDILDKLGLRNQRLIRTFLSLAGAGDVLRLAVASGNKGFNEAIALTREAEKRYGTLASQFKILRNKANDVAITIGTSLIPVFNDLIGSSEPLIAVTDSIGKSFADLPKSIRAVAVAFAGLAIAAGPVLFVGGKLVSTYGVLLGLLGTFISLSLGPFILAIGAAFLSAAAAIAIWRDKSVKALDDMIAANQKLLDISILVNELTAPRPFVLADTFLGESFDIAGLEKQARATASLIKTLKESRASLEISQVKVNKSVADAKEAFDSLDTSLSSNVRAYGSNIGKIKDLRSELDSLLAKQRDNTDSLNKAKTSILILGASYKKQIIILEDLSGETGLAIKFQKELGKSFLDARTKLKELKELSKVMGDFGVSADVAKIAVELFFNEFKGDETIEDMVELALKIVAVQKTIDDATEAAKNRLQAIAKAAKEVADELKEAAKRAANFSDAFKDTQTQVDSLNSIKFLMDEFGVSAKIAAIAVDLLFNKKRGKETLADILKIAAALDEARDSAEEAAKEIAVLVNLSAFSLAEQLAFIKAIKEGTLTIVASFRGITFISSEMDDVVSKTEKWADTLFGISDALRLNNRELSRAIDLIGAIVLNWENFDKAAKATGSKIFAIIGALAAVANVFVNKKGPQTTTSFGGLSEGDFSQEFGDIGAIIGGIIGSFIPVIGTILGAFLGKELGELIGTFIKKGADEFLATIDDIKGRIITDFKQFDGRLQEIGELFARGIVGGINSIIDSLGGTLVDLPTIQLKIRGDLATVFINGIEKSFDNIKDAIEFAIQEALRTATISGLSPAIMSVLKNSFGKTFEQFTNELNLAILDAELQLDPFALELRKAFQPLVNLRKELERLGIAADGTTAEILRTAENFRDSILGITKDPFEVMIAQAAIFNAEMARLGLTIRITNEDLAEANKRLNEQTSKSAGISRRQARESFEDTLNDIINNSLDAVQSLIADHTRQLADLEKQRKKTKVGIDLFNKAVDALNKQLAESLRNLGESIAGNLSPIAAMVFRMNDVRDSIKLLRDNFIEFGFTIEQVDNIIRDFGENEFLRIASGLAQFIDDEELLRDLEILRAKLTIANFEFQIQMLLGMGILSQEQADFLMELVNRAKAGISGLGDVLDRLDRKITSIRDNIGGIGEAVLDDEESPEDVRKLGESIASTLSPLAALFFRMRDLRDNIGLLQRRFQEFGFSAVALRLILRNFGQTQFLEIASGLAQFIDDEELKRDLEHLRAVLTIANFELQIEMLESMGAASGLTAEEFDRLREILGQAKDAVNDLGNAIDDGIIAEQIQSILDEARTFLSSGIQLPSQRLAELNDKFRDLAAQLVALGVNVDSALAELNVVFVQVIDAFIMSLIDPLRDLLGELLGDIPGSRESFQILQQQFKDIAGLALGGDIDAIAELPDAIRAFRDSIVARFGANSVEAKLFNEQFRQILQQLIAAGVNIDELTGEGGGGATFGLVTGNQMIEHSNRQFTLLEEIRDGINTLNEDHEFAA